MTLIVGIRCVDGIAIAADREVTNQVFIPVAQFAQKPVMVQTSQVAIEKIVAIDDAVLLGTSGMPPIGDEYEAVINKHRSKFPQQDCHIAISKVRDDIRPIIEKHLRTAKLAEALIGPDRAYLEATVECFLAATFKDGPRLVHIQRQGAMDVVRPTLPMRAIGSGQIHADPFLVFLKNTFWPQRLTTVAEGILAACWAIDYATEVGAPGVGRGINAFSIGGPDGVPGKVTVVSEDDIKSHRAFIEAARQKMRDLADLRHATSKDADAVPTLEDTKN